MACPLRTAPKRREGGFSMVELIVVLAIISILSGMLMLNARSNRDELALQQSGRLALQAIDRARNNTLGNKSHAALGTSDTLTLSQGGYGVHFAKGDNFLTIFADCNDDQILNKTGSKLSCEEAGKSGLYPEIEEIILLRPGVTIGDINSSGCIPPPTLVVVFIPPYPKAEFKPEFDPDLPTGCSESAVVLINSSGETLTIFINGLGVARAQRI